MSKNDKLPVRLTREKERRHKQPIPEIKCYIIRDQTISKINKKIPNIILHTEFNNFDDMDGWMDGQTNR